MFKKIAEAIVEFVTAIAKGNKIALGVLLTAILFIVAIRIRSTAVIELPKQAHNTIGNLPIVETLDDGGTNKEDQGVESRIRNKNRVISGYTFSTFLLSQDVITFR